MISLKSQDQGIIKVLNQDFLPVLAESFLIDRKAQGFSPDTIDFYKRKLHYFLMYSEAVSKVSQLTPDFIRLYLLKTAETHNPGGVHACFRPLRTLLLWIEEEEIMPPNRRNPIRKVKAPKLPVEPIEPIALPDVGLLVACCTHSYAELDRRPCACLCIHRWLYA